MVQRSVNNAGATPKHMKSDKLSSSAPNLLVPRRARAILPSKESRMAAIVRDSIASAHFPFKPNRIAVIPAHKANIVKMLGIIVLNERPFNRFVR